MWTKAFIVLQWSLPDIISLDLRFWRKQNHNYKQHECSRHVKRELFYGDGSVIKVHAVQEWGLEFEFSKCTQWYPFCNPNTPIRSRTREFQEACGSETHSKNQSANQYTLKSAKRPETKTIGDFFLNMGENKDIFWLPCKQYDMSTLGVMTHEWAPIYMHIYIHTVCTHKDEKETWLLLCSKYQQSLLISSQWNL